MDMAPVIHTQHPARTVLRAVERTPAMVLATLVVVPWITLIALGTAATLAIKLVISAARALARSTASHPRVQPTVTRALTNEAIGQLIRFVIAGLGVTALSSLIYLVAAVPCGLPPLLANTISHLVGVIIGYAVHSRWSFRAEPGGGSSPVLRFAIVSGAAFALNSGWVWLATGLLDLPAWTPVPAMLVATPLASFALNRYWVFAAARP